MVQGRTHRMTEMIARLDPASGEYYLHLFSRKQPDLNWANPEVRAAQLDNVKFWLDRGVDGLRLDAIPYLCVRDGTSNENLPETHAVIRQMRAVVDAHYADRMFLAEANQWPADLTPYFADGDEFHMAFHFPLMPRMFMAIRLEDRKPIVDILQNTPQIPDVCQWGIFLRNHDELTLEMVTDEEASEQARELADVIGDDRPDRLRRFPGLAALGLVVAIPAVWFYNYLTGKVEYFNVEMDNSSSEMVDYFIKKTA